MTSIVTALVVALVAASCLVAWMTVRGKVYVNKIAACRRASGFCGIASVPLELPDAVRRYLDRADADATRVDMGRWKRGRTLDTTRLARTCPDVIAWYTTTARDAVSRLVGDPVVPTDLDLPTSACLLVYDREGDRIDWHFDVNYYDGRFFTVLVPVTTDATATRFTYRDAWSRTRQTRLRRDRALVFEGDRVFHAATPLGPGERRVVLSLQFTTDPGISRWNRALRRLKDVAYIGV